jgi:hypothetical protein
MFSLLTYERLFQVFPLSKVAVHELLLIAKHHLLPAHRFQFVQVKGLLYVTSKLRCSLRDQLAIGVTFIRSIFSARERSLRLLLESAQPASVLGLATETPFLRVRSEEIAD